MIWLKLVTIHWQRNAPLILKQQLAVLWRRRNEWLNNSYHSNALLWEIWAIQAVSKSYVTNQLFRGSISNGCFYWGYSGVNMKVTTDSIAYHIFIRLVLVFAICAFVFFGMIWIGTWFMPFLEHSFDYLWDLWKYKPWP